MEKNEIQLFKKAFYLSLFTIVYNVVEAIVSMLMGYQDETLALFGFGVDSFIEVISGIGIAIMILRIRHNSGGSKSKIEIKALRITGASFYILTVGLVVGIILSIIADHKPATTFWGVIISSVSILIMVWLVLAKKNVGKKLKSEPIIADANCTKICVYMSIVLLFSSLIYEFTGFKYSDVIGTAGLVYFSFTEGMEAFEKAKTKNCACSKCSVV